jgi:hypothetical protein
MTSTRQVVASFSPRSGHKPRARGDPDHLAAATVTASMFYGKNCAIFFDNEKSKS